MSASPSMPLFIDAYLADTTHLTTEQHGVYLLLLMSMWRRNGTVPDDDKDIARIVGLTIGKWRAVKARLMPFLTIVNGEITQKRLQKEWNYVQEKREKNARNGSKGGRTVCSKNKDIDEANGSVWVKPNASNPVPIPVPLEEETPTALSTPTDLYAFQASNIRLTGKSLEQWRKAFPHITLESELLALDEWAGGQGKNWFHAVSSALAKRERTARDRINMRVAEMEAGPRRAVPDGRI